MGFRENCRYYRKLRGMTQDDLAKRLGLSRVAVTQWESGYSEPRMGMVSRAADVLGVPLSVLISETPPGVSRDGYPADADEKRLLDLYRQLNDDGKARLLEQAEFFAASGNYRRHLGDAATVQTA